ncbi:hypothetical protein ACFT7S_38405 [Streptomyces sp. NPDC057136]|uniref:hypothetical protein n=1 Tax=Streptomyces sp. NPDC057136 TaxID=3346029 RepID=UPI00362943C3
MITARSRSRAPHSRVSAGLRRLFGLVALLFGLLAGHGVETEAFAEFASPNLAAASQSIVDGSGGHSPMHPTHECSLRLPEGTAAPNTPGASRQSGVFGEVVTGEPVKIDSVKDSSLSPASPRNLAVLQV